MSEPIKQNIEPSVINRIVRGVKYMVTGSEWFSPQQPIQPAAQEEAKGRQFDYPTGYNVNITPRSYEPISFQTLRLLADNLDILRLVIETRKDLMCKLKFEIKPLKESIDSKKRCEEVKQFLKYPDQQHSWEEWLRMILEDLFVIDAPTIYPRLNKGGGLFALELMDGATIAPKINGTGRQPLPPEVAYQQILKGVPAVDYSSDELIYKPRNLRTHKVYGFSPVEQIITIINIALRRQISQLQYYTEGSTPDLIFSVPETWNPDQIRMFEEKWNSYLLGNTGNRRGTKFVPSGVKAIDTKDRVLKDEYDEWIVRIICFAFSISPQNIIKQMNKATAETSVQTAKEEGLEPIKQWVKNLMDYIIHKYFGFKDIELIWSEEKEPDLLQLAQINQIYVQSGIKKINEVRAELGLDPIEEPETQPPPEKGTGQSQDVSAAVKLEKGSKKKDIDY
jgi:hypothetical protein